MKYYKTPQGKKCPLEVTTSPVLCSQKVSMVGARLQTNSKSSVSWAVW